MKRHIAKIGAVWLVLTLVPVSHLALAQDQEEEAHAGGVVYNPNKGDDGKLRDPFKSPFEIEQEEREGEEEQRGFLDDMEEREPFNVSELTLKGIYLQATTGYWAIFSIGTDYKWYQKGAKFLDGELINITDGAVYFEHYLSTDTTQVREVVKELHRGEE